MAGHMTNWESVGTNYKSKWIPPSDRQLTLRSKLDIGWSVRTGNPGEERIAGLPTSLMPEITGGLSEMEMEQIKGVLARAEEFDKKEQERIGKLADKLERMRKTATGNGISQCTLCGAEFGILRQRKCPTMCHDCKKNVCQNNCGLETVDGNQQRIFLCKICSETREMWKKSGAWFYNRLPVAPEENDEPAETVPNWASRADTGRPTGDCSDPTIPQSAPFRPPVPPPIHNDTLESPRQPRWARVGSLSQRGVPSDPIVAGQVSQSETSGEENGQSQENAGVLNWEQKGVQRIVTKCGRFNESDSDSDSCRDDNGHKAEMVDKADHNTTWISYHAVGKVTEVQVPNQASQPLTRPTTLTMSIQKFPGFHEGLELDEPIWAKKHKQPDSKLEPSTRKISTASMNGNGQNKAQVQRWIPVTDLPSSPEEEESNLGTLEFSLLYDGTNQSLTVRIFRGENLKSMDSNGLSDPYVKLHLLPSAGKSTKLRTKTIHNTLNPEWNEKLMYYGIGEDDRQTKTLRLTVLDEDRIGHDFIGETKVPLKRLSPGIVKSFNVYLEKHAEKDTVADKGDDSLEERGKILLGLMYNSQRQCLMVEVIRCVQLIGKDPNGYSDPYVKITLRPETDKKHRAKTTIKKKTLNPEYNETFTMPVTLAELRHKTLDIDVWDKDVAKNDDFIGSLQLGSQVKGDYLRHWNDCLDHPGSNVQRWHKLTRQ